MYKLSKKLVNLFRSDLIIVFGGKDGVNKNIENICKVFNPDFICSTEENFKTTKIPYVSVNELSALKKKYKKISVILAEDGLKCDEAYKILKPYKFLVVHYTESLYIYYSISSDYLTKKNLYSYKDNHNNTITITGNKIPNMVVHFEGFNNHIYLDNVYFDSKTTIRMIGSNNEIRIGKKTSIGEAAFTLLGDVKVTIGEDCLISYGILFHPSDGHPIWSLDTLERLNPPKDITIGNHVWIGLDASFWGGAEVGSGSMIAAKALIPGKKFEENALLAGIPAKVIRSNIGWSRDSTKTGNYQKPEDCHDKYILNFSKLHELYFV